MALDPIQHDALASQLDGWRAQYDKLGRLIAAAEEMLGETGTEAIDPDRPATQVSRARPASASRTPGSDEFVGLTTSDAVKAYLAMLGKGNPKGPRDIAQALVAGGRNRDESKEYMNVASALKRMNKTGEVKQVRRGEWGLGSWYGTPTPA